MAAPTRIGRGSFLTGRFGPPLKVFISYRRRFDQGTARLLRQELTKAFGDEAVFRDVERIEPGEQFPHAIESAIKSSDVFLAVISPGWLGMLPDMQSPSDYVRTEIVAALAGRARVIPVLVGGGRMPEPEALPEDVRGLASRHALELSDSRWDYDVGLLIKAVRASAPGPTPLSVLRAIFGAWPGRLATACVLLAAIYVYATRERPAAVLPPASYEECVRLVGITSPKTATVSLNVQDSPVLSGDEYGAVRASVGVPLLLLLKDSGRDLGAVLLRYDGPAFSVVWVMEPPCNKVEYYFNNSRPRGMGSRVLHSGEPLRMRLGGRIYHLVLEDSVGGLTATLGFVGEAGPSEQ